MTIRVILRGGFSAHGVSPGSTKPAQGYMGRPCTTLYVTNVQYRPGFVVLRPRSYAFCDLLISCVVAIKTHFLLFINFTLFFLSYVISLGPI